MWYEKVVGQQHLLKDLHHSLEQDTLSHALIIEGPSGYGGLPVALSVSQRILCHDPQGDQACGVCKSCLQTEQLKHPDLHFAYPVVKKDGVERKNTTAKDFLPRWREQIIEQPYLSYNDWIRSIVKTSANGDINTKECADIIQQLNFQAFSGDKKVQIIWIADKLGNNGNKLLKLIEEPPSGTYLIMVCDDLNSLLLTIRSRCRIIRMPRIDEHHISEALIQQDVDTATAQQVAFIADGDFGQAQAYALLDSADLMQLVGRWMDMCAQLDLVSILKWSREFHKYNGEEQRAILNYMLKALQAALYYNHVSPDAVKLSTKDKQLLSQQRHLLSLSIDQISEASQLISKVITQTQRFVNGRMLMVDASLQMGQMLRSATTKY